MENAPLKMICRVEDTFCIKGRGRVLLPEAGLQEDVIIRYAGRSAPSWGESFDAHIRGIEFIHPNPKHILALMLDPDREVSVDTEVWMRPGETKLYPSSNSPRNR